jgi:glycosyltransferase involved in cell wall biosynthesis
MTPLISIILPAFNRPALLREAVDSVFAQTFSDWELIVADDGSDEITHRYLRELQSHPSVRLLRLAHSGCPARVRNAALRVARGTYVAFLDSDDLWTADKLVLQLALLQSRPDCQWSYSAFVRVDVGNQVLAEESRRRWLPLDGQCFAAICTGSASIRPTAVLARKSLLDTVGGFDEQMMSGEDYDLWMRLALASGIALLNKPVVRIRLHGDNFSSDWETAYVCRYYSLRKIQQLAAPHWQPLLATELSRTAIRHAAALAEHARYGDAVRVYRHSFGHSWMRPTWWWSALQLLVRTTRPQ